MSEPVDVLVVGAGPTGLALALQAHDHGARVRIVERRPDEFRPSRAFILHPRTLELLRPLGVTEQLLARADTAPKAHLHIGARVLPISLGELSLADTAYPHLTFVRQMEIERVLSRALAERGVEVERGTELVEVDDDGSVVRALLRSASGITQTECQFVAGCDGQGSTVRQSAGIEWHGGSYGEEVVLADVELDTSLDPAVVHASVGRRGLLVVFTLGEHATWRLLTTRPAEDEPRQFGQPGSPVSSGELQALLDEAGLDARITKLAWSARYPVQHRIASQFREGRLFLAGDAAHAYSPATGQGMNTGIHDATNLGWKLAFAATAPDPSVLLDSYDLERRPAVRRMLSLTHLAFWGEAGTGFVPALMRGVLTPVGAPLLPTLMRRRWLVSQVVRVMSQLWVAYPNSPLSVERTPRRRHGPRVGHRLPDEAVTVGDCRLRLHSLLAEPGVHVLLHRGAKHFEDLNFGPLVTVYRLTSTPGPGLVAVRPDGYVGFRCEIADAVQLRKWLASIGANTSADNRQPQPVVE